MEFGRLIDFTVENGDDGYQLAKSDHWDCDSACYDCLKDYSNMVYHGLLDWRLAMDMARYAHVGDIPDFKTDYWNGIPQKLVQNFCKSFDWDFAVYGGIPCAKLDEGLAKVIIPIHPLWNDHVNHLVPQLAAAVAEVEASGLDPQFADLFQMARRPALIDSHA